jgi:hypothetical protein
VSSRVAVCSGDRIAVGGGEQGGRLMLRGLAEEGN